VEPEVYVYALLLSKVPVMYCLPCAARDHLVYIEIKHNKGLY